MGKIYRVKVKWTRDLDIEESLEHEDKRYEFLYMVLRKRKYRGDIRYKILYIGMTYNQYLSNRLKNHHKLLDIVDNRYGKGELVIRFGNIIFPPNRRISKKLVSDIEAALIQEVQPEYNEMSIYAYRGREIKITNLGDYEPLSDKIDTSEWEVI